jgi:hypothetical protein
LFPEIFARPAVLQFDRRQGSCDGGAILLKVAERRYGSIGGLAGCLEDKRQAGKVDHPLRELLAERVFPVAKRLRGHARRVTIDLDPAGGPTRGAQQLSFFNSHCDSWCYLPAMGFVSFNDEAEQYLCAAVLRPGNATAPAGAVGILRRLPMMVRHFLPGARIRVRLDGGFAHPGLLDFLDAEPNLEHVVAMAKNAVLQRKAEEAIHPTDEDLSVGAPAIHPTDEDLSVGAPAIHPTDEDLSVGAPAMQVARALAGVTEQTEHVYSEANCAAGNWPRERRIILKAEAVCAESKEPKDNPRFVIANMKQSPQWLCEEVCCQRGEIENRIEELHELQIDRTSCSDFRANQFRVLPTAAACIPMQELRLSAANTNRARAQAGTLRERLLKLGVRVVVSLRRMVLHLPASFPFLPAFRQVARALGASPG